MHRPDDDPGPLCGSIPVKSSWEITPGHQVAALVSKPKDPEERWILGTVVKMDKDRKYIIEDIMETNSFDFTAAPIIKERYTLSRKNVLPLPRWTCRPGLPGTFYSVGSEVLALYPQTTCFYPAVVQSAPTVENPGVYTMCFYDDAYEDGRVRYHEIAVRYVVGRRHRTKKDDSLADIAGS